jgi:hypothetical protein
MNRNFAAKRGRILSLLLVICVLLQAFSIAVFAQEETSLSLTEGDLIENFADPESGPILSSDRSVAYVDAEGALKALKEGTATVTVADKDYQVTVEDYTDGTDVVGQLKILARFNDSMSFYDGHVYLLFTSYKDGVEIKVDDLYAGYEIRDQYYTEIRRNIANGSNHTGSDTEKYFTFRDDMTSVTLDRGEIVTIGMYRDFYMSIYQAIFGTITGSSMWGTLTDTIKGEVINALFKALLGSNGNTDPSDFEKLIATLRENGLDYHALLDGVVDGGVCFNRELYNQKLEWDQYENVTYELDITENQLKKLTATLGGNLNRFSMLKNSCATVTLRAWNAAVGTKDGEDTAYKLDPTGEGLFALIDAPKTVKNEIVDKLPGYYLNKSDSTPDEREPNAGYFDETGWVYVSAPEVIDVAPASDESRLHISILGAPSSAKASVYYINGEGEKTAFPLGYDEEPASGTTIYVNAPTAVRDSVLTDITLDGVSILDNYDEEEQAYFAYMPDEKNWLNVTYGKAQVRLLDESRRVVQIPVGSVIDVDDYAELTIGENKSDELEWQILSQFPDDDLIAFTDDTHRSFRANKPGDVGLYAKAAVSDSVGEMVMFNIYDAEDAVRITFNDKDAADFSLYAQFEDESRLGIPFSGYYVKKESMITLSPHQTDPKVIAAVRVNGQPTVPGQIITADADLDIKVEFRKADITNLPDVIHLQSEEDAYPIEATVQYSNPLYSLFPVYDNSVKYLSADPLISVDENGIVRVTGEIPEEGRCAYLRVYAGSSNNTVYKEVKVILGDYTGDRIVGRLTIFARPMGEGQSTRIPHTAIEFTTYEDIDLNVSYFRYYRPNPAYKDLLDDYKRHPENYGGDPALFATRTDIEDRESYFEEVNGDIQASPEEISLKAGEGITMSYYPHDDSDAQTALRSLSGSFLAYTPEGQALIEQITKHMNDESIDGPVAFDSFMQVFIQMYAIAQLTGHNPIDGISYGGFDINREVYNQFCTTNSQLPNHYYTVEITADELARLTEYIADPSKNYYSLFTRNCASGCVDLWNQVFSDRPELQIKGNYTTVTIEPESIYVELGLLPFKTGKFFGGNFAGKGEGGGSNHYPRVYPAYWDIPGDVTVNGDVNAADALMALQAATAKIVLTYEQERVADVDGNPGVTSADALQILQYATGKIESLG